MKSAYACFAVVTAAVAFGGSERVNVDKGWQFQLNGGACQTVNLPHDWSIAFAPALEWGTDKYNGFLPGGIGEYRKDFEVKEESTLCFEGAYRDVSVYVNDELKTKSYYGYLPFSAPLKPGLNRVRVVVNNSAQPNAGNYTGSGINRHVWLAKKGCEEPVRPVVRMPKVTWDSQKGLLIDGRPIKLHGGCVHENYGPLGSACWDEAATRLVRLLKKSGFNAIRQGHHPFSEAFLDACDREGLYVLADYFDVWFEPKQVFDYSRHFEEDWETDFRAAIRRDRRHPSILIWSVGNEVNLYTGEIMSEKRIRREAEQARKMVKIVREEDPHRRPTTIALCAYGPKELWHYQDPLAAEVDIVGYNYLENETEEDRRRCPNRLIAYTEVKANAAATTWRKVNAYPYVIGEFVWAAADYLGESTVGRWYYAEKEPPGEHYEAAPYFPWHGSTPGDIDITGWRKPISHYRETLWHADAPTYMATREPSGWKGTIKTTGWASWPTWESWTYPGWEGRPITVEIYSRKPKVTLTLNGKVVGERENGEKNDYLVRFEVPYAPGVIECDGVTLKTAGPVDHIRYTEETIGRLTWITAEAVDKNGTFCPNAENEVTFEGNILGTCSADLRDLVPAPSRTRKMYRGRAQAVRLDEPTQRANEIELPPCGILVGNAIYNYFGFFPSMYGHGFTAYWCQYGSPLELVERTVKENQGNIIQFWPGKSDRPQRQAAWLALEDLGYKYDDPDWTNLKNLSVDEFPEFKKYEKERAGAGMLKLLAACESNGLYSTAIYLGDMKPEYAKRMTENKHYIGYDFGEIFSFTYTSDTATNAAPRLDKLATDLTAKIRKHVDEKRAAGYGLISCTSSSFFMDYEIAAGVDFTLFEDLTSEMNLISSLSRGLARQHGRKIWGSHIANEYYDWIWWGTPHYDETLYTQMAMKYMAGAKIIISESGAWHCQTPAKDSPQSKTPLVPGTWKLNTAKTRPSDAEMAPKVREAMKFRKELAEDGEYAKGYRRQMSDFYDYVKKHGTPAGQPETTFAIAKGNYDLWGGSLDGVPRHSQVIAGLHGWAEQHNEWFAGAPEDGWRIAHDVFWPCGQGILGTEDLNRCLSGTPWGQIDIVSFAYDQPTAEHLLKNYKAIAFLGWNTCSEKQYRTLCDYVKGGGRLFISIPQFSKDVTRNAYAYTTNDLVRTGDFTELCGLKVLGRGEYFFWGRAPHGKRLPWIGKGDRQVESYGAYRGLTGKVEVSNPAAETVLYDNESGDTVLYRLPSGKGEVWFLNSWFYPGTYSYTYSVGSKAGDVGMTGEIVRHLAKLTRGKVYITEKGSDDPGKECTYVNVSHFPSDGTILLLNIDFAHPHTVDLHVGGKTQTVTLKPHELWRGNVMSF